MVKNNITKNEHCFVESNVINPNSTFLQLLTNVILEITVLIIDMKNINKVMLIHLFCLLNILYAIFNFKIKFYETTLLAK